MAVAFDAISTAASAVTAGTSVTHNNMTVGAISNGALIGIFVFSNSAVSDPLTTATWNGVAMTKIGTVTAVVNTIRVDLYGLVAPAAGNKVGQLNWTGTSDCYAAFASFSGVDQTGGTTSFAHFNSAKNNTTTALTAAITSAIGNYVVGGLITTNLFSAIGNTLIFNNSNLSIGGGGEYATGAASVNVTATKSLAADDAAVCGVDLVAAAAAATIVWGFDQERYTAIRRKAQPLAALLQEQPSWPFTNTPVPAQFGWNIEPQFAMRKKFQPLTARLQHEDPNWPFTAVTTPTQSGWDNPESFPKRRRVEAPLNDDPVFSAPAATQTPTQQGFAWDAQFPIRRRPPPLQPDEPADQWPFTNTAPPAQFGWDNPERFAIRRRPRPYRPDEPTEQWPVTAAVVPAQFGWDHPERFPARRRYQAPQPDEPAEQWPITVAATPGQSGWDNPELFARRRRFQILQPDQPAEQWALTVTPTPAIIGWDNLESFPKRRRRALPVIDDPAFSSPAATLTPTQQGFAWEPQFPIRRKTPRLQPDQPAEIWPVTALASSWSVMAVGGGGWVTGIDMTSDGTKVTRTDVGGGYIYNSGAARWGQLVTNISMPSADVDPDFSDGVYEIRIAPSSTSRFYMIYVGFVYKSTNSGATWTKTAFTRQAGFTPGVFANDSFRMYGEKIAVDPINSDVVYISDPVNGWLWFTTDAGATWTHDTGVAAAIDGAGITGICFDSAGGTSGGRTQKLYCNNGTAVYVTTNAGTSWTALAAPPARVRHADVGGGFYYCCSDSSGTTLYRTSGGAWTTFNLAIGTIGGSQQGGLNHGVTVDPADSTHIVVSDNGGSLAVTSNSGASWQGWAFGGTVATGDVTWLANVNEANFMSNGAVRFDPSQSNKLIFSEGIGVWTATPPTSSGSSFNWQSMTKGIEELEAHGIVAPNGHPVVACQDRTVFYIADPTVYPSGNGATTGIIHGWSIDYATADSTFMVIVTSDATRMYKSTDGGQTWSALTPTPYSFAGGGCVALQSSTSMMALNFTGSATPRYYNGTSWLTPTYSPAIPPTAGWSINNTYLLRKNLAADRVTSGVFYAFNNSATGGLYKSTDGGATFTRQFTGFINTDSTSGDAGFNVKLKAVPGNAGHLFFTNGQSGGWGDSNPDTFDTFWKSTDGGVSWSKPSDAVTPTVAEVYDFGFGAAKPGGSGYPALFIVGWVKVSGVWTFGVFRSDDAGVTYSQVGASYPTGVILYLGIATCIDGDPTVYNRCYLGFPGGGWAYYGASAIADASVQTGWDNPEAFPNRRRPMVHRVDEPADLWPRTAVGTPAQIGWDNPEIFARRRRFQPLQPDDPEVWPFMLTLTPTQTGWRVDEMFPQRRRARASWQDELVLAAAAATATPTQLGFVYDPQFPGRRRYQPPQADEPPEIWVISAAVVTPAIIGWDNFESFPKRRGFRPYRPDEPTEQWPFTATATPSIIGWEEPVYRYLRRRLQPSFRGDQDPIIIPAAAPAGNNQRRFVYGFVSRVGGLLTR